MLGEFRDDTSRNQILDSLAAAQSDSYGHASSRDFTDRWQAWQQSGDEKNVWRERSARAATRRNAGQ
jgi:hypothetical protein